MLSRRTPFKQFQLCIILGLMVFAAACGGTDPDAVSNKAADDMAAANVDCGLSSGEAAAGDPINVGAIVGETGPDDFSSSAKAAAAYFACVNANGGINGRPVEYIVEDDAWNPEQAGQVAAKLINDDEVVAMVGNTSFVECGANAQAYSDSDVVVIAGVGVPRECFEHPNIAPINQGPRLSTLGAAIYAHETYGSTKFACMGTNIPNVTTWACESIAAWGADKGIEVTNVLFDPATLDPTSLILEATASEPDTIIVSLPAGAAIPILGAAEEQDLRDKYKWVGPTSLYDLDFPAAVGSYWDGAIDAQIELNATDSPGADNQNWLALMDAFGNEDDPRDTFSQAGYLAAKVFTEALLDLDADGLDRATVTEALRGVANFESDLLCGPWYFGPGEAHNANHSGRIASIADGGWVTSVPECFEVDDPDLASILELEAQGGLVD